MNRHAGRVVTQVRLLRAGVDLAEIAVTGVKSGDQRRRLPFIPLELVAGDDDALGADIQVMAAELVMGRFAALRYCPAPAIQHYQRGPHGFQIQLDTAIVRMGLDAAQGHYQLLPIGVQPQLVGVHTAHGKILQMPVAFVHGIDADDSLAARIVVGSGVEPVAGLAEHPMPVEMKADPSFNYCLKTPFQHIDYIEVAPWTAGEN